MTNYIMLAIGCLMVGVSQTKGMIPESFINMSIDNYDEFLKERRKLMAQKIKEYYNTL